MSLSSESVRPGTRAIPYIMFTNDDAETSTFTGKNKVTMAGSNNNNSSSRLSHASASTGGHSKLCSLGYGVDDTDDENDGSSIIHDKNNNNNKSNKNCDNSGIKSIGNNNKSKKSDKVKSNKKDTGSTESSVRRNSNGYKVKRVIFPLMASYESEFMRACLQGLLTYPGFESSLLGKRCDPKSTCKTVGKSKSNVPTSSTTNGSTPSLQTEEYSDKANNNRLNAKKGMPSNIGHLLSHNELSHSHRDFNTEIDNSNNNEHAQLREHEEQQRTEYQQYHAKGRHEEEEEEEEEEKPTTSLLMYGNDQLEEEEELHLQNPVLVQSTSTRRGDHRHDRALSELQLSEEEQEEEQEQRQQQQQQEQQNCKLNKEKELLSRLEEENEQKKLLNQQRPLHIEHSEQFPEHSLVIQEKSKQHNPFLQREKQLQSVHLESGCVLTTNAINLNVTSEVQNREEHYKNTQNTISINNNNNNNNKSAAQNVYKDNSDWKSQNSKNASVNKYVARCKEAMIVSRSNLGTETDSTSTCTNTAIESLNTKRVANERKHLPYAQMTDFATGNLFTSASLTTNPTSPSSLIVREIDGGIRNHWGTQITTHASMCYRDYVLQSQAWLKCHNNNHFSSTCNNNKNKLDAPCHLELSSSIATNSATAMGLVHLQCVPIGSAEMDVAIRNEVNHGTTDLENIYFAPIHTPQCTQWNVQRMCNEELMEEEEDYDSWSSNHVRCMPTFPFPQLTSFVLVQLVEYLVRRSAMELNESETIDICTDVLGSASSLKDATPEVQQQMIQRGKRLILAASFLQM